MLYFLIFYSAECFTKKPTADYSLRQALESRPLIDVKNSCILGKEAWAPLVSAFQKVPCQHPESIPHLSSKQDRKKLWGGILGWFLKEYFLLFSFFGFYEIRPSSAISQLTTHISFLHRKHYDPNSISDRWKALGKEATERWFSWSLGKDCISCRGQCSPFRFQFTVLFFLNYTSCPTIQDIS